jgi:hypothetical protein
VDGLLISLDFLRSNRKTGQVLAAHQIALILIKSTGLDLDAPAAAEYKWVKFPAIAAPERSVEATAAAARSVA